MFEDSRLLDFSVHEAHRSNSLADMDTDSDSDSVNVIQWSSVHNRVRSVVRTDHSDNDVHTEY